MRPRSHSVKLVLASTLPLALAACSQPDDTVAFSMKNSFKTVQECVDSKVPVDVCSDAYMQAMADHRKIAPSYDDQASCDADFVEGYCQATSDGKFTPKLGGFELAMTGTVPKAQYDQAKAQVAQSNAATGGGSGGGDSDNGLLTGLLLGNMLSGGGNNHYYSQPVYQTRDDRGSYTSSTLSRQIEQGKTFSRSSQARSTGSGSYTPTTLGSSLSGGSGTTRSNVSSTISRGGFGQQATARSGWGGKSSSGFSTGG
ncbi:DUF1190 domain-containing protein (plasmid) [Pseudomonas cannabina pv. alisalensis]|uniref:DUF1190 domain-containing protein n=1 Tax=Pseudomonas syringae pv. maculicola str. ES4326 TaxID=629265 RepID=A0A8T8CB95_PSEYM|nr:MULTISPECIES: DUF1190 domain-containing protein [Pseudomonas syringae group]QHF00765.1 DUF1190 domain-containing protein [Pseudomonas syringae pv. maculicola str. ES4326]UBZ00669.1 DUF1190 domain-containing protein [Pseudomonas cannabina pv. alisalensis]